MNREQLEHAIRASGAICGDRELWVVGSQAILGPLPDAHPDLLRSMEVDIAPKNQPELAELIEGSIGELSPFHQTFGFYVDGIDVASITLPDGWQQRTVPVDNPNTNGFRGLCLDPADLAVSKLAAARPKDLDYVRVLVREEIVTVELLLTRVGFVPDLEPAARADLERHTRHCGPSGR